MHAKALSLYRQKTATTSVYEYTPIARALNKMDKSLKSKMMKKFEVAYTIAKEWIAFAKMSSLCDLIEWQGISLGEVIKPM